VNRFTSALCADAFVVVAFRSPDPWARPERPGQQQTYRPRAGIIGQGALRAGECRPRPGAERTPRQRLGRASQRPLPTGHSVTLVGGSRLAEMVLVDRKDDPPARTVHGLHCSRRACSKDSTAS